MVIPRTVEICILDDLDSFGPPFERYFLGSVERVPYFGPPPKGPASLNHRDPLIESFYMLQRTSLPILALYSGFEAYPSYVPNTDSTTGSPRSLISEREFFRGIL